MSITKVLYVHSSDEMYGADLSLLRLVTRLNRDVYEPIVVLPNDISYNGLLSEALEKRGIKAFKFPLAVLRRKYFNPLGILVYAWYFLVSTVAILYLMLREKVDIVHTNTIAVIPGALAAWITGRPHIWHIREIIVRPRLLWRLTSWIVAHLSTRIIVNSNETKHHICTGNQGNQDKTVVVHNGIDLERFDSAKGSGKRIRAEWNIAPEHVLVGMVGRVSYRKGQDYFIKVARRVSLEHPEARFALVGGVAPGQHSLFSELEALIDELELADTVILCDYRTDIPSVLDAYDVFVLPSTEPESFGNVVLEAMAMSKPAVANDHGGCVEIIKNNVTGILVPPGCPDEMASAISQLIEDPARRREMGANGRRRLQERFLVDSYAERCQDVYSIVRPQACS